MVKEAADALAAAQASVEAVLATPAREEAAFRFAEAKAAVQEATEALEAVRASEAGQEASAAHIRTALADLRLLAGFLDFHGGRQ